MLLKADTGSGRSAQDDKIRSKPPSLRRRQRTVAKEAKKRAALPLSTRLVFHLIPEIDSSVYPIIALNRAPLHRRLEHALGNQSETLLLHSVAESSELHYAVGRRTADTEAHTTIFAAGSDSKQFLSASLGILMQDFANGKNTTALPTGITQFDWSTKMKDLLPGEWEMDNEWGTDKADLKDLLSHRTGLPNHDACYSPDDSPVDIVAKFKNLRTTSEMRQFWEYNNQYSGMTYRDFVEQRIFKPLKMTSSTMHPDVANATGRFSQTRSPLNRRCIPFFLSEHSADLMAGAGGVISNVEDLVIWVKTMLNGGVDKLSNQRGCMLSLVDARAVDGSGLRAARRWKIHPCSYDAKSFTLTTSASISNWMLCWDATSRHELASFSLTPKKIKFRDGTNVASEFPLESVAPRRHLSQTTATERYDVQILFGHLDSQSENAVLVHAFQHALPKWGGIDYMLNSLRDSTIQVSSLMYPIDEILFIRNCPPPSEFFQGCKDILQQLDHLFQQTEQKEQKVVLLYGLGGAGKTQIALKFIADSGSRFTDQFKINASSAETIEAGYRQLAIDKKLEDTVEAAQTWLKANQGEWLILFDNADKRDLNLGPYLPKYDHGNILITSRNPDLWVHTGSPEKTIQIPDLTVDDASVLLLNRAGIELESGENKKDAAMIAKELHCFPLAIIQAGAFISKSPRLKQDMSRYVQFYQKNKAKLLSEKPAQSMEDYNKTVYTTWRMSFDQLSQLSPLAAQFLQLCSFMHFEGISEDIFERASTYEIRNGPLDPTLEVLESSFEFLSEFRDTDMTWNSLVFENITSELCGYSLMTWQKGGYSIHPLVHQWSRTTITDLVGSQKLMVGLLGMAAACGPEVMQEIQLFLHILRLSKDIDMIGTGFEPQLGSVFYAGGLYRRAETLQSHVVTKSDSFLGAEHPDTIHAMANLAATYSRLGRYTDAQTMMEKSILTPFLQWQTLLEATAAWDGTQMHRPWNEKVLEQCTRLLGAEHPDTILAMENLAGTYNSLGRYTDAQTGMEKVLDQRTRLLGAEHPDTIRAMANHAAIYSSLGRDTDAQTLKEKVLEQRTRLFGAEHPDTILAMANLAVTYSSLGRDIDAQALEEKVLEQRTRLLGAEHPHTILAMANLARSYSSLGRDTDAQTLEEKVLEQCTRLLGAEHPHTIIAMANLAGTYSSLGRYTDAQTGTEKVLEQRTRLLGAEHPDTIRAMANLAGIYSSLGQYTDAQTLEEKVLEQCTRLLGAEHPHTIIAMANLAVTYSSLGRDIDAQTMMEKVLERRTRLLGAEHPDTILAMANLAATYSRLGRYTDAQTMMEKVLEQRTRLLGAEHPDTILAMANLARTYSSLGRYTDAQTMMEKVLEQRTRLLGAEHPDTILAMANLARTYSSLGWYTDAQTLEKKVLEQRIRLLGAEHPDTIRALANLAATYSCLGQYTDAQTMMEKVLEQQTRLLGAEHPDTILAMANLARTYSTLGHQEKSILLGSPGGIWRCWNTWWPWRSCRQNAKSP
ncbi:hypothetical protein C8F01DRAFT_1349343 [Mycena amicta]|nr:hypothetical protein C8F01DRAFT_1349343 [Mycena amicta]